MSRSKNSVPLKPTPRRLATELTELYPPGSILADIVDLTRKNTDLAPSLALFGGYSRISCAMAQSGFTLTVGPDTAVSPNLLMAVLGADNADAGYVQGAIVQRAISTPKLRVVPGQITAAAMFGHASAYTFPIDPADADAAGTADTAVTEDLRCLSLLNLRDCEDWLKMLHTQNTAGKLRSQLVSACDGQSLFRWSEKNGEEHTAPLYFSIFICCQQSPFFDELAGHIYSKLMQQLLLVLADDRPSERMPIYGSVGIDIVAAKWNATWQVILAGPRNYVPTLDAESVYRTWWQRCYVASPETEQELRRIGRAAWKYGLVVQALLDPNGKIGAEAMQIATAIADRHLADQVFARERLACETADQKLARKVSDYIGKHPEASRGTIMHCVAGAANPTALNRALTQIAELNEGSWLGDRALELRAASRMNGAIDLQLAKA